jgi:transcription elongation factor GreA
LDSLFWFKELTSIMSKINYYTAEGLKKLKAEIEQLERIERPKLSALIGAAIDLGDLSENAEYHAAKESQGLMEARISKLKNELSIARVIDGSTLDISKALILSKVKIKNVKNGMEVEYTLVAGNEADLKLRKISVESPIGKGLLGKSVGDIAPVETPNGIVEFEIIAISR